MAEVLHKCHLCEACRESIVHFTCRSQDGEEKSMCHLWVRHPPYVNGHTTWISPQGRAHDMAKTKLEPLCSHFFWCVTIHFEQLSSHTLHEKQKKYNRETQPGVEENLSYQWSISSYRKSAEMVAYIPQ